MSDEQGRVVVVAAGFALWLQGKCVAAARWSDIRRVRAMRRPSAAGEQISLIVELTDGTTLELLERAPGFDLFAERAVSVLTGLRPIAEWRASPPAEAPSPNGTLLFERAAGPPTRPSRR